MFQVRCEASHLNSLNNTPDITFITYCKQWWGLTVSHLTEQSECVSWWPGHCSDSHLISISADLPKLTGVIVPTEYLPQRMKTYSFIKSQGIASLELYICSGLFPELPTDNQRLPPIYESMAMCQLADVWMASSLTVWCWGVNTFVWPWQKAGSDGYDIGAPWHYCSHWEVCRSPHLQDTGCLCLSASRTHTPCTHAHEAGIKAWSQIAYSFNDPSSVWAAIVSWPLTGRGEQLWDGNVAALI